MGEVISLWPLTGIAVIVVGFLLRFNPVLVVIIAGIVTGLAAHMPIATILEKLGEGFLNTRNLPFILLIPLAVIGLLERHGLKERAQAWIAKIRSATSGRLLIVYLFIREATAALGLTSTGGIRRWCARCWRQWRKGPPRKITARYPARFAIACAQCQRRPITSGCFSVKISLLPSARSYSCTTLCWSLVGSRPNRCISPCGDPDGNLCFPDPRHAFVASG